MAKAEALMAETETKLIDMVGEDATREMILRRSKAPRRHPTNQAIPTEGAYKEALVRIDEIMESGPDPLDDEELDILMDLVMLYEGEHRWPG